MTLPLLSPRQREIVTRLCYGESERQIAVMLTVSRHTVKSHIRDARQRIGGRLGRDIPNSTALVAWALALNEIPLPEDADRGEDNGQENQRDWTNLPLFEYSMDGGK